MAGTIVHSAIGRKYDISSLGSLNIGTLELEGFKSATLTISGDTVDNSTRTDGGWGSNAPGTRNATLSVTCNKVKEGDTAETGCQKGLRALYLSDDYLSDAVKIVYKTAPDSSSGVAVTNGFEGNFVLTSYAESQQYGGEAVEISMEFASVGAITANTNPSSGGGGGSGVGGDGDE